jgi:hypothetical protein
MGWCFSGLSFLRKQASRSVDHLSLDSRFHENDTLKEGTRLKLWTAGGNEARRWEKDKKEWKIAKRIKNMAR